MLHSVHATDVILIVEDDDLVRDVTVAMVEEASYLPLVENNADESITVQSIVPPPNSITAPLRTLLRNAARFSLMTVVYG